MADKYVGHRMEEALMEEVIKFADTLDTNLTTAFQILVKTALDKMTFPDSDDAKAKARFVARYWDLRQQYHKKNTPRGSGSDAYQYQEKYRTGREGFYRQIPERNAGLPALRGADRVRAEGVHDG